MIPNLLFLFGWVKPILAVPIIIGLIYIFLKYYKNTLNFELKITKSNLLIICSILFIWVLISGIGGFIWQNRWDHMFRNAIFQDLVKYDWPVSNADNTLFLCYYIGYWLPSALIAKIFNSILVGYICQLIYGFIGIFLGFSLISFWLKKVSYITLIVFILFCGLSMFKLELGYESVNFRSSSNTNLLFWVYNQCIPFWITFMLILIYKDNNNLLVFIYSLSLLFGPLPLVGISFLCVFLYLKNINFKTPILTLIKQQITIVNTASLFLFLVVGLYYKSNISANASRTIPLDTNNIINFITYMLFEYLIFIFVVGKRIKSDYIFFILLVSISYFSFQRMGYSYDFSWKTSIPLAFYTMLIVIQELIFGENKIKKVILSGLLIIGSIQPLGEIVNSLEKTIQNNEPYRNTKLETVFIDNPNYNNFIGGEQGFFFRYISK